MFYAKREQIMDVRVTVLCCYPEVISTTKTNVLVKILGICHFLALLRSAAAACVGAAVVVGAVRPNGRGIVMN